MDETQDLKPRTYHFENEHSDATGSDSTWDYIFGDLIEAAPHKNQHESQETTTTTPIPHAFNSMTGSVDPQATMVDAMDVELPQLRAHSFSPTFHEWDDHNHFFHENILNSQPAPVGHDDPTQVAGLQAAFFESDGLTSAVRAGYEIFGAERRAKMANGESQSGSQDSTRQSANASSHSAWTPLSAALELQLVQIYFQTLHTLCPVIDELDFYQWYQQNKNNKGNKDSPSQPLRELTYNAIIFAAFAHVDDDQLKESPYSSVPDGQKALFDYVRDQYNSVRDSNQGAIELVQVSLILSHWSPYDETREVNYFWADEATRHALLAGFHQSSQPHHRIIWWCGLQRNRTLTLALRRPHKLKQYPPGRLPVIADFGSRWMMQNKPLKGPKIYAATLFIWLCKLSVIMNEIVLLRHNSARWDDWRGNDGSSNSHGSDLDRIVAIDKSLTEWNSAFERTTREFEVNKIPRRMRVSGYFLYIVSQSTKASLYEQYIELSDGDDSMKWLLNTVAVNKLKETSAAIALQVDKLLGDAAVQDLPLNVPAWILLPISVLLSQVKAKTQSRQLEATSSLGFLLRLISDMSARFVGVQHTTWVIQGLDKAFDKIVEESNQLDPESLERELIAHGRRILKEGLAFGAVVQT